MNDRAKQFRRDFEGHRVSLSLVNGSRIDDCQMVSAARGPTENVWVFSNGVDHFVALSEVADSGKFHPHGDAPPDLIEAIPVFSRCGERAGILISVIRVVSPVSISVFD